jgi:ubiquitin C-terminal hydrolase
LAEAISTFLGKLHDDLNVARPPRPVPIVDQVTSARADLLRKGDTVVIDLFWGVMCHQRRCTECGKIYSTLHEADIFTVHLPISRPEDRDKTLVLEDCIHLSADWDRAKDDSTCCRCNAEVAMDRQTTYIALPRVLILQLVRFEAVPDDSGTTWSFRKDDRHVNFDLSLDMSPWVCDRQEAGCCHYDLHAVIQHSGVYGGRLNHYTAGVRTGTDWHFFNDETVLRVTPRAIQGMEAYCLVYVRRQ